MNRQYGADDTDTTAAEQANIDAVTRESKANALSTVFNSIGSTISDVFGIAKNASGSTAPTAPGSTVIQLPGQATGSGLPSWLLPVAIGGGALLFLTRKK